MSLLSKYVTPAERRRKCVFAEAGRSNLDVVRNGATIYKEPTINHDGIFLDGSEDGLLYNKPNNILRGNRWSVIIDFIPLRAADSGVRESLVWVTKDNGGGAIIVEHMDDNTVRVVLKSGSYITIPYENYYSYWNVGQRCVIGVSSYTTVSTNVFMNGNKIVSGDTSGSDYALRNLISIGMGYSTTNYFFYGTINSVKLFDTNLTDQEQIDYWNKDTFNYMENVVTYLPMTAENHDAAGTEGEELLIDGAMEASGTSAWTTINVTVSKETDNPQSGSQYLKITSTGSSPRVKIDVDTNSVYRMSGYCRGNGSTSYPRVYTQSSNTLQVSGTVSTDWQAFDVTFYTGTDTQIWLYILGDVGDSVGFDSLSLKKIAPRTLDISGNNNHAIFGDGYNSNIFPTKLVKCGFSFDGNDYLTLPNDSPIWHISNEYSIAFVIKNVPEATDATLFGEGRSTSSAPVFRLRSRSSTGKKLVVQIRTDVSSAPVNNVSSTLEPIDGQTHTIIWTDKAGDAHLYIDGQEDPTDFTHTAEALTLDRSTIGAINLNGSVQDQMTGNVLFFSSYNKQLTPTEVADLHINMMKKIHRI